MEGILISYQIIPKDKRIEAEFELSDLLMLLAKKYPGIDNIDKFLVHLPFRGLLLLDLSDYVKNLSNEEKIELKKLFLEEFEKAKEEQRARAIVKVVPFDKLVRTDLVEIEKAVAELSTRITGKWRITLRRRGDVKLKREDIIKAAAKPIDTSKYPVDLKNPDFVVYIDIIGDLTGILIATKDEAKKLKLKS